MRFVRFSVSTAGGISDRAAAVQTRGILYTDDKETRGVVVDAEKGGRAVRGMQARALDPGE